MSDKNKDEFAEAFDTHNQHEHEWQLAKFVNEAEGKSAYDNAVNNYEVYSQFLCPCGGVRLVDYSNNTIKTSEWSE